MLGLVSCLGAAKNHQTTARLTIFLLMHLLCILVVCFVSSLHVCPIYSRQIDDVVLVIALFFNIHLLNVIIAQKLYRRDFRKSENEVKMSES